MKITKDCKVKAKIIEVNLNKLADKLIDYYKNVNEIIYLSLRKDQLTGKNKTYKKVMKLADDDKIKDTVEKLMDEEDIIEIDVEIINDNVLIIMNDNFDDDEYKYNEALDMYFNETSKVFVRPDLWGADKITWHTYLKLIETI